MKKKGISLILALSLLMGIFMSTPFTAGASSLAIDTVLEAQYTEISLKHGETQIYQVTDKNGKEGLLDTTGSFITACQWDFIDSFDENGLAIVYNNEGYGVINRGGTTIVPPMYDFIERFNGDYAKVFNNGKYGFFRTNGSLAVPIVWKDAAFFSENKAAVKNDSGQWGYVDQNGQQIIACTYLYAGAFIGGVAWVSDAQEQMGAIDATGQTVIGFVFRADAPCAYQFGPMFGDNGTNYIAAARLLGQEKYCYINKSGTPLTQNIYDSDSVVDKGGYAIVSVNGSLGVIKEVVNGSAVSVAAVIAPMEAEYINRVYDKNNSLFFVYAKDDGKYGLYNSAGVQIIAPVYNYISYNGTLDMWQIGSNTNASVQSASGGNDNAPSTGGNEDAPAPITTLYGFCNSSGQIIIPVEYGNLYAISYNLIAFSTDSNDYTGFMDANGNISQKSYDMIDVYSYSTGYLKVKKNDKWGIVDLSIAEAVPVIYDNVKLPTEGFGAVKKGEKWGFYNLTAKTEGSMKYNDISPYKDGLAWVVDGVKAGAIDHSGQYVITPQWTPTFGCWEFVGNTFHKGVTAVKNKASGRYMYLDMQGLSVTNYSFDYVSDFDDNNLSVFENNGYYGMLLLMASVPFQTRGLSLDKASVTVYEGSYRVITGTVTPQLAANKEITWTSANSAVATVDAQGRITGVSAGTVLITAALQDNPGISRTVLVTVEARPNGLSLQNPATLIPLSAWEGQMWLADAVMKANEYENKTVSQLTYGDLLAVYKLRFSEFEQAEAYSVPPLIAQFSNLVCFESGSGLLKLFTIPSEFGYLSNLQRIVIVYSLISELNPALLQCDNLVELNLYGNIMNKSSSAYNSLKQQLTQNGVEIRDDGQKTPATAITPYDSEVTCIEGSSKSIDFETTPDSYYVVYDCRYEGTGSINVYNKSSNYLYFNALTPGEGDIIFLSVLDGSELARVHLIIESRGRLITSDDIPDPVLLDYLKSRLGADELYEKSFKYESYFHLSYYYVNGGTRYDNETGKEKLVYRGLIQSLTGLDTFDLPSLSYLNAENQGITALDGLSGLTGTTEVDLSYNYISEINSSLPPSFYRSDVNTYLYLSYNCLTSMAGLEGLKNCYISLAYNDIDFSDAANQAILEQLEQDGCYVSTYDQFLDKTNIYAGDSFAIALDTWYPVRLFERIYPRSLEDNLTVVMDNPKIARFVQDEHMQQSTIEALQYGSTGYKVMLDGQVIQTGNIHVPDPENPTAPKLKQYTHSGSTSIYVSSEELNTYGLRYKIGESGDWTESNDNWSFDIYEYGTVYVQYQNYYGCWSETSSILVHPDFAVLGDILEDYSGSGGDIVIPDNLGITSIGYSCFSHLYGNITSVVIPEGVTYIGFGAFRSCYNLSSVTFPDSLTSIESYAFMTTNLTSIVIPEGVTYIGYCAFGDCFRLKKVYFKGPQPTMYSDTFAGYAGFITLYYEREHAESWLSWPFYQRICLNEPAIRLTDGKALGIQPSGHIDDVIRNLIGNQSVTGTPTVTLQSAAGVPLPDTTIVGTGMKLIVNGTAYTAVVAGDVDGDGIAGLTDMVSIKKHSSGTPLSGVFYEAGCIAQSKTINAQSLVEMKKYMLNISKELTVY